MRLIAKSLAHVAQTNFAPPSTLSEYQWQKSQPTWTVLDDVLLDEGWSSVFDSRDLEGVPGAFTTVGVLTTAECRRLIDLTTQLGYCVGTGDAGVRSSGECVVIVPENTASELAARIAWSAPQLAMGESGVSVNRRWRFYRYEPPVDAKDATVQRFSPHLDGSHAAAFITDANTLIEACPRQRSKFSVLLYLNDCDGPGGETAFYSHEVTAIVKPKAGAALIFHHGSHALSPLHEGRPLRPGAPTCKYVARTDLYCMPHAAAGWTARCRMGAIRCCAGAGEGSVDADGAAGGEGSVSSAAKDSV